MKVFASLIGLMVALAAGMSFAQDITIIDLGYDVTLAVAREAQSRGVRATISQLDDEWQSVGIGDAGLAAAEVQKVKFCADCGEVYFLPIWNAPKTDGTVTGVMVYERGPGGWSFAILPLDRPTVEDRDGDGIFTLIAHPSNADPIQYTFREGLLTVAP